MGPMYNTMNLPTRSIENIKNTAEENVDVHAKCEQTFTCALSPLCIPTIDLLLLIDRNACRDSDTF